MRKPLSGILILLALMPAFAARSASGEKRAAPRYARPAPASSATVSYVPTAQPAFPGR